MLCKHKIDEYKNQVVNDLNDMELNLNIQFAYKQLKINR